MKIPEMILFAGAIVRLFLTLLNFRFHSVIVSTFLVPLGTLSLKLVLRCSTLSR